MRLLDAAPCDARGRQRFKLGYGADCSGAAETIHCPKYEHVETAAVCGGLHAFVLGARPLGSTRAVDVDRDNGKPLRGAIRAKGGLLVFRGLFVCRAYPEIERGAAAWLHIRTRSL